RLAQGAQLPREHVLEAHVVAGGGQGRAIGGQRDRGDRRPVLDVADGELGRQVLRVGGAAAIAEPQDLAAAAGRRNGRRDQAPERLRQRFTGRLGNYRVLVELGGEEAVEVHPGRL